MSVHTLWQRLDRSEKTDDLTYQNTELCSQLNDVEEEFSSKVAELEEKIELLITEVELARHEQDISFLNASMIFSPTLFTRKRTKVC